MRRRKINFGIRVEPFPGILRIKSIVIGAIDMDNQPPFHRRRELHRLPDFNYAQPGFYFITSSTHQKQCLFGVIEQFSMRLSNIGMVVQECWTALPRWFPNVSIDQFVVMPNHFHGIIEITDFGSRLKNIVGSFKSATTRLGRQRNLLNPSFVLWQRGYYEHIIRSDKSLFAIRQYIADNPTKWNLDELNPARKRM